MIELMIVVAILAISATIAGPPMTRWIQSNRVLAAANTLLADIKYARSEALRNSRPICLAPTGTSLSGGWRVFTVPSTALATNPCATTAETVLKTNGGLQRDNIAMTVTAGTTPLAFNADGSLVNTVAITVTVADADSGRGCDGSATKAGCSARTVSVARTGRTSTSNPNSFL